MRLSHLLLSEGIDPQVGSVFRTSLFGSEERITILDAKIMEVSENAKIQASHVMMVLTKWDYLWTNDTVYRTQYVVNYFPMEEGVGGRMVASRNVIWTTQLRYDSLPGALHAFRNLDNMSWNHSACGYEVEQIS
jgi:hypothetical protein